jgi:hypothetical protein
MRQTLTGLVAAIGLMTAGAAPAMACGFGGCSPCAPCAQSYVPAYTYAPAYNYSYFGCGTCGGWGYEHLAAPTTQFYPSTYYPSTQYYYVNQGPTYSGPGAFAPEPTYEESAVPAYRPHYGYYQGAGVGGPAVYGYHHHYRPWHHSYRYGYAPHHYGYQYGPYYYGRRVLHRYY